MLILALATALILLLALRLWRQRWPDHERPFSPEASNELLRNYGLSPVSSKLTVFLSSVMRRNIEDLSEDRDAIAAILRHEHLFNLWRFEDAAADDNLRQSYLRRVEECGIFVIIVGRCITPSVKEEFDTAVRCRKPILVFLKQTDCRDDETRLFIDALTPIGIRYKSFNNLHELQHEILRAVCECVVKYFLAAMPRNRYLSCIGLLFLLDTSADARAALAGLPAFDVNDVNVRTRLIQLERQAISPAFLGAGKRMGELWGLWFQALQIREDPLEALPIAKEMVALSPSPHTYLWLVYTLARSGRVRETTLIGGRVTALYAGRLYLNEEDASYLRRVNYLSRWMWRNRKPFPMNLEGDIRG